MKVRTSTFVVLACLVVWEAGSASAHHNMSALFDFNDRVTSTGTLTKMDWRNPHIYVFVDAKRGEAVEAWSVEGPPPNFFRGVFWGRGRRLCLGCLRCLEMG